MDLRLDGKRALVTGSTAGIGYAIAEGLAQEGAEVIVNGRSAERVAEVAGSINKKTGTKAIGIAADLGSADGVMRLVNEARRVDILVNNVGIFAPVPFTDISDDAWQEIFDINVMSGVRLSRAFVPGMVERGWGRIIFISSESGVQIRRRWCITALPRLRNSRCHAVSPKAWRVPASRRMLSFQGRRDPKALRNSSASWRTIRALT